MPKVQIGLIKVNKSELNSTGDNRMKEFGIAVRAAGHMLNAVQVGGVRVLIAPEYYWSGYETKAKSVGTWQVAVPMNVEKRREIYAQLQQISKENPDIVLVDGSVYYAKSDGVTTSNVCPVLHDGDFLSVRPDTSRVVGAGYRLSKMTA